MHTFEVWAPAARTLEVKIEDQKFPLFKRERGWWSGAVEAAGPGTDYLFVINGEEPGVPDPRSRWQPNGVHGPSRIFNPAAFAWSDAQWQAPPLPSAVLYELHIGTFTTQGTLEGAECRLDYLKELGITHIQLMPVAAFAGDRGWGYDGVDLYAPHSAYGGPTALQHFVNACHEKGLAVLLDVVYNHLGFVGNYLSRFAPYFTAVHFTPWGEAVNLEEAESTEVRRFFIDNALMWLRDYHCDGLRLDAVHAFVDRSAIHFLEQLTKEVRALEFQMGKHFVVIAESDLNDPRLVSAAEAGGFGMDAQWSDDFHHALFTVLTGERQGYYRDFGSLAALVKSLREVFVYAGGYSEYRRRNHGRPVVRLPGYRFLGYAQNHDQVGNRAKGDRLSQIAGVGRAKIAAALVLSSPFIPLLFQGEEFGASTPFQYFTSFEDPEMGRLVSAGRKREFASFVWNLDEIPDPQERTTFERSKLDWTELHREPHAALLAWHKDLIGLRRALSELTDGALSAVEVRFDEDAKWLIVERGRVRVACNLGKDPATVAIESGAELLLASEPSVKFEGAALELGPDSVGILLVAASGTY
jgi:maltooligosyltrehalose trehalohydrolase